MDSEALAAASRAVSGPDTPAAIASTSRPDRLLTLAMAGAGPVICLVLGAIIFLLGQPRWSEGTATLARIGALRDIGMALCLCLVITVVRLASGAFRSGSVKAGPASMDFEAR
jgi:hypothetical protein